MTISKDEHPTQNLKINILPEKLYNPSDVNPNELYFVEDESNIWLIAVDSTAPISASTDDKYFNTTTNLIYTYDGSAWSQDGEEPDSNSLYINSTNNYTYVYNGTTLIQVGGGGGITVDDIDETTITLNSSNKIQASGTIDKNSGNPKYDWIGTNAEWILGRNNGTIPDSWICYITDDNVDNPSINNVYNRLNRAYAWSYKSISAPGTLYNIGYNGTNYYVDTNNTISASKVISPSEGSNYIIVDGILYHKTVSNNSITMTPIDSDNTWTYIHGNGNVGCAIKNGDLYSINTLNKTLKDSGGWQQISYGAIISAAAIGIKNDSLYLIPQNGNNIHIIDSSGVWSQVSGGSAGNDYYMFGIKDGKLYSISYSGVVREISSDNTWQMISGNDDEYAHPSSNYAIGINNGKLYALKYNNVYLIDETKTWVKCCGSGSNNSFAITNDGKLYTINGEISSLNIELNENLTNWSDISGWNASSSLGINNGDVYLNLSNPVKLTSLGGNKNVFGCTYSNTSYSSAAFLESSASETLYTVYTVPSPQIGFNTYSDENLTQSSIITAVNMNNNTITDGNHTYVRNASLDKVFTSVSLDSKQQLISMADLLNAIKG